MKAQGLIIICLIALVAFMFIYYDRQDNIKFNETTKELKVKSDSIKIYKAEVSRIKADRQIIENRLNDAVKESKSLRIDLNKLPKVKIVYKDKIVEVIKFETLPDCQIKLNLCLIKLQTLEERVAEYLAKNKELDLKNIELDMVVADKTELLESERKGYKKKLRKKNLIIYGLGLLAVFLAVSG